MRKKTLKGWEKSGVNLDEYIGKTPCEVDEALFLYYAEVVSPQYDSGNFVQTGEASFDVDGVLHYSSLSSFDGKYFYLGILPKFKKPKY